MRDRGTVILTKMFASIRGIQRFIRNNRLPTLSQHDYAVLTKNRGNEKFATFFMTVDSSRRAESNDTNIDMVFFKRCCRIYEKPNSVAVRLTENFQIVGRGSFIIRLRLR